MKWQHSGVPGIHCPSINRASGIKALPSVLLRSAPFLKLDSVDGVPSPADPRFYHTKSCGPNATVQLVLRLTF